MIVSHTRSAPLSSSMAPATNGGDGYDGPFVFCSFFSERCGAKAGGAKTETAERANKLAKGPLPFPGVRYFDLKAKCGLITS